MTTLELKQYYANLLILQYISKPKASATVQTQVDGVIMDQLPDQVEQAFDIDSAAGVQLDILGKYVGISRQGFDFSGPVTLGDADYRQVIRMKTFLNNSNSTLNDIQNFIHLFFNGQMFVYEPAVMHIGYLIDSSFGSLTLIEFFVKAGLLPKPMAVLLAFVIFVDFKNLFGFRTTTFVPINKPFNSTHAFDPTWKFLTTHDSII